MADEDVAVGYGIEAGQEAMTSDGMYPWLKVKNGGERVRLHLLTSGSDPLLVACKFHRFPTPDGKGGKEYVCVHSMTHGAEPCTKYCDIGDTGQMVNRFALWVFVHTYLHTSDNPDEKGPRWQPVNVKIGPKPEDKRMFFKEDIDPEKAVKILRLSAGRGQSNYSHFTNAWMQSGDLRKHLYELERRGEGLDTTYQLRVLKAEALPVAVFERDDVKTLPPIDQVFRGGLRASASNDGVLGADALDGNSPPEDLPVEEEIASIEDDLI